MTRRLLRTRDLIAILQKQDPEGGRILSFEIPNDTEWRFEVYTDAVSVYAQNARQTEEGDANILRVNFAEVS